MKFIIEGVPVPYARPRVTKNGTYNPKLQEKEAIYWQLHKQFKENYRGFRVHPLPIKRPLSVDISFFMPIPKTLSDKKRQERLGKPCCTKPDIDNLIKMLLDAGINSIWWDDNCIANISARKVYDLRPRTEIIVEEIG